MSRCLVLHVCLYLLLYLGRYSGRSLRIPCHVLAGSHQRVQPQGDAVCNGKVRCHLPGRRSVPCGHRSLQSVAEAVWTGLGPRVRVSSWSIRGPRQPRRIQGSHRTGATVLRNQKVTVTADIRTGKGHAYTYWHIYAAKIAIGAWRPDSQQRTKGMSV